MAGTMTMQIEVPKLTSASRFEVMRVRQHFVGPYRKYRFVNFQKPELNSRKAFIKKIETVAGNWPPGTYFLKTTAGQVFARFDISLGGKLKKLYDISPATNKPYPIAVFWAS